MTTLDNDMVMKLDFDPKEIDQLLDYILEECPDIILNVLRHQSEKPVKKKPKETAVENYFDSFSRCSSVEVLTRNAFYSLPRNTSKPSYHIPPFNPIHRFPSNINVSISFGKKCLFDHQIKNRSLENLSKCTCVLNTNRDYKKPSKVHFGRPLIFNCNHESSYKGKDLLSKYKLKDKQNETTSKQDTQPSQTSNPNKTHDFPKEHNDSKKRCSIIIPQQIQETETQQISQHLTKPQAQKQQKQTEPSTPSLKISKITLSEQQTNVINQRHDYEEATDFINPIESPLVGSYTIIESFEINGVTKTTKPSSVSGNKDDVLNFNFSLKNDKGSYNVEKVENKDIHYVCLASQNKVLDHRNILKPSKFIMNSKHGPVFLEKSENDCVSKVENKEKDDSTSHHKSKEKLKSKKHSQNELRLASTGRRSSRSSGRSMDRKRDSRDCDHISLNEQNSNTSSVLMWRELEEELKRLNDIVKEEDMPRERKHSRRESRKHSETSLISKGSKSNILASNRSISSLVREKKLPKKQEATLAYIDTDTDTLSLQSNVKPDNYFVEEEKKKKVKKMKEKMLKNDHYMIQKPPYPRSHSAKVIQLSSTHDSLERKMRSQKYLGNGIAEDSDKEFKKRWKVTESDGESTASLFCGGGLELLKELRKIEVLKKTPLRNKMRKNKEGKKETVYDSESCSSRMSKDSFTMKSIDFTLDQYLNDHPINSEHDYGNFMKINEKIFSKEKDKNTFTWYKKEASKSEAIEYLRNKPVGSFLIRDSNSFPGAYGLVLKIETPSDPSHNITETQSIRNFLIESTKDGGVRIRGSPLEPVFPDLQSLVTKHSQKNLSLPCKLLIPSVIDPSAQESGKRRNFSVTSNPGLSCSVLYLSSENVEALAENTAISKATQWLLERNVNNKKNKTPLTTVCDLQISRDGLVLTDTCRTLFFRRHYPLESLTFAAIHEDEAKWTWSDQSHKKIQSRIFGILSRNTENRYNHVCHLFAELDFPAADIVEKVNQLLESMEF